MNELPRAVATIVGDVLGGYYYSHSAIENLFYEYGASGDPPMGNCRDKITQWLVREAKEDKTKALQILEKILEEFMDTDLTRNLYEGKAQEQDRVVRILKQYGLEYRTGGRIFGTSVSQPSKSLNEILRERNLPELNQEFERAIASVDSDPPAAVTAACSILESLCKVYIQDEGIELPSKQTVTPLWSTVSKHIGLSPSSVEEADLRRILSGIVSMVDGIGAFRTHASSAHGRGRQTYRVAPRHARLVVHAAHSLVTFVVETWDEKKNKEGSNQRPHKDRS